MMVNSFLEFTEKYNMFSPGETVLAAVSGGADSMCMLCLLIECRDKLGCSVAAAHYNHGLRGDEADRDEAFVEEFCSCNKIPFYSEKGDVAGYAALSGKGTEEAAREMRYDFLFRTAEEIGAGKIATAHTADDNAETVLMDIMRGSGIRGLAGVPPVRGKIVRPILFADRKAVEAYLTEKGCRYVTDSSNNTDDYMRNRVRHNVMPVLKALNPSVLRHISVSSYLAARVVEFLDEIAEKFLKENFHRDRMEIASVLNLHYSIASRVLIKAAGKSLSFKHVESILKLCRSKKPSGRVDLPGITVAREYGTLVFGPEKSASFSGFTIFPGETAEIHELGLRVFCSKEKLSDNIHKTFTVYLFKTTEVYGKITIRPRKSGDRIKTGGLTKTLKKLFIEKKIPRDKREAVPVIADERGVIGVYGLGQDDRCVPSPGDTVYKIKFEELNK